MVAGMLHNGNVFVSFWRNSVNQMGQDTNHNCIVQRGTFNGFAVISDKRSPAYSGKLDVTMKGNQNSITMCCLS